jgi:hypothetical protein
MHILAPRPTSAIRDGRARVRGRESRVSVTDLASRGCRIAVSNGFLTSGDDIMLKLDDIRIIGRVSWCDFRDATVEFRNTLHDAVVEHLGFQARGHTVYSAAIDGGPEPLRVRSRVLRSLADASSVRPVAAPVLGAIAG